MRAAALAARTQATSQCTRRSSASLPQRARAEPGMPLSIVYRIFARSWSQYGCGGFSARDAGRLGNGRHRDTQVLVRTGLFEGFTDRYFPGAAANGEVDATTAAEHAAMMAGLYTNSRRHESNFLSMANLMGATAVTANEDGTISVSELTGLNGQPLRWREIAPFVWRDLGGKDLLAAKVENGKVVMFSAGDISPFMMFQPYEWWKSPAWLSPALTVSLAALLLTVVMWPVAAITRRRYGVAFALSGRDAWSYRGVRLVVIAVFVVLIAWVGTLSVMTSSGAPFTSKADWWFWLLNLVGLLVFVGSVLVAAWNARVVWSGSRGWFARFWSIVLALACVTMLWTAWVCRLISFNVNY